MRAKKKLLKKKKGTKKTKAKASSVFEDLDKLFDTLVAEECFPSTRKDMPVFSGVLQYFPDAILEVSKVSKAGNDQHNPGQPLHWDRSKSTDEADALTRHLLDAGKLDTDGIRHTAKVAWRALALLQKELEDAKN